jgi:hypothetical protein
VQKNYGRKTSFIKPTPAIHASVHLKRIHGGQTMNPNRIQKSLNEPEKFDHISDRPAEDRVEYFDKPDPAKVRVKYFEQLLAKCDVGAPFLNPQGYVKLKRAALRGTCSATLAKGDFRDMERTRHALQRGFGISVAYDELDNCCLEVSW